GSTPFARFLPEAAEGAQVEISEAGRALAAAIGARVTRDGGWALIVDYGYAQGSAATLQAVRSHQGASILEQPGETDLSAHVDFTALAAAAEAPTCGPVSQADFLKRQALLQRAEILKARATEVQRLALDVTVARLIAPDQMGTLFK